MSLKKGLGLFQNAEAAFALGVLFLLCRLAFGQIDSFTIEDIFGRPLNSRGITLVDWEGYLANPAIKLFIKPPLDVSFPLQAALSASGPRLYFDLPSTGGAAGPSKTLAFGSVSEKKPIFISVFPDRDSLPEDYSLTIAWNGAGGTQRVQNVSIHVIDQDKEQSLPFDVIVDFSQDKTGFFADSLKRSIIQQAAADWAYFIDDLSLDSVAQSEETTWIWNQDGFKSGYYVTNSRSYNGFLLYVYGIHHDALRSGGEPSAAGGFQASGGKTLPLKRSGGVEVETQGNYNSLGWFLTAGDDDWWFSRNLSGEPNDLYSIVRHEMGHALFFESHYPRFAEFKSAGAVQDPQVYSYHGRYPRIDASDHFNGEVDRASGKGMFGNEYHGYSGSGMPLGRWIITKLDLLCAQAIGYKLKRTSALIPVFIGQSGLPRGRVGTFYSGRAAAEGGIPFYHWSVEEGYLPDGLALDSFAGEISGRPERSGVSFFLLRLKDYDESGPGVSVAKSLTVDPPSGDSPRVIAPNGGEVWEAGSRQAILWEAPDSISEVRIDYTPDSGKNFKTIEAAAPNNGLHLWSVPDGAVSRCFLRVSDAHGAGQDASDSAFSIYQPLHPPMNFRGEKKANRSVLRQEYVNALKWDPDPRNRDVVKYRIYRQDGLTKSLLAEVEASVHEFLHRRVAREATYVYAIISVNAANEESEPAWLTVR